MYHIIALYRNPVKVVTGGSEVEVSKDQENEIKDGDVIKFCEDKFHYSLDLLTDESDNETDQKMSAPSSPEKSRAEAISDQSKPLKSESLVEIPPSPKLKKSRPDSDPSQDAKPESQNHLRGESEKEKSSPESRQEKYDPEPEKPTKIQPKSETVESLSEKSTQNQEGHSVKSKPQSEKDNANAHGSKLNEIKPNHKPEAEKEKRKVEPQEDEKENKKPSKPAPVATGVESGSDSVRKLKTTPPKKNGGSTTPLGAESPKDSDGHKSKDESDGEDSKQSVLKFLVITPSDIEDSDEEKPAKPKPKPKPNNSKFINIAKVLMTKLILLYFSNTS